MRSFVLATPHLATLKPRTCDAASAVTMEFMSTAIVVAVVAMLMLLGIGMVVNQLLRLRKFLKDSPPDAAPGGEVREPPDQPH